MLHRWRLRLMQRLHALHVSVGNPGNVSRLIALETLAVFVALHDVAVLNAEGSPRLYRSEAHFRITERIVWSLEGHSRDLRVHIFTVVLLLLLLLMI